VKFTYQLSNRNEVLCVDTVFKVSIKTCGSSGAGIAQTVLRLGYGLNDGGLIPGRGNNGIFSLHHCIHTSSGNYPAFYTMGTRGSFPRGKETRARS
jgi:hypothetical protein